MLTEDSADICPCSTCGDWTRHRRAIRDTFVRWEASTEGAQATLDG